METFNSAYEDLYLALIAIGKPFSSQVAFAKYTEYRLGLFPGYGVLSALEDKGLIFTDGEYSDLFPTEKANVWISQIDFDKVEAALELETEKKEELHNIIEKLRLHYRQTIM